MSRLIHLNGPPGIGKSTLARRHVAEQPGVLNCDIDVLRTMIVASNGGDAELGRCHGALERLLLERPDAVVIASVEGAEDQTYDQLVDSLV